jgi:hypothetical protein
MIIFLSWAHPPIFIKIRSLIYLKSKKCKGQAFATRFFANHHYSSAKRAQTMALSFVQL